MTHDTGIGLAGHSTDFGLRLTVPAVVLHSVDHSQSCRIRSHVEVHPGLLQLAQLRLASGHPTRSDITVTSATHFARAPSVRRHIYCEQAVSPSLGLYGTGESRLVGTGIAALGAQTICCRTMRVRVLRHVRAMRRRAQQLFGEGRRCLYRRFGLPRHGSRGYGVGIRFLRPATCDPDGATLNHEPLL